MIDLKKLVKRFGDLVAVNEIDLSVGRGEFFAVLGPNAAGKTTMIKMLVGLIHSWASCAFLAFDLYTLGLSGKYSFPKFSLM